MTPVSCFLIVIWHRARKSGESEWMICACATKKQFTISTKPWGRSITSNFCLAIWIGELSYHMSKQCNLPTTTIWSTCSKVISCCNMDQSILSHHSLQKGPWISSRRTNMMIFAMFMIRARSKECLVGLTAFCTLKKTASSYTTTEGRIISQITDQYLPFLKLR